MVIEHGAVKMRIRLIIGTWGASLLLAPAGAEAQQIDDERAIASASREFDAAFSRADLDSISAMLTADVAILSVGGNALALAEVLLAHREMFAERPGMSMTREVTHIGFAPNDWGIASEQGRWVERWMQDGEEVVLSGTYATMWRRQGDRWSKSAELLIALQCEGPYCSN
jgi:ketosteroid isomerase-like protein